MKISSETKLFLGILGAMGLIIGFAIWILSRPTPALSRDVLLPTGSQVKGNASASAFLVEFSDFQCPGCKRAKAIVDQIVSENKEKLVFGYRHFPLPQHEWSKKGALASEAAGVQGKFWEMYDGLFANQDELSDEKITELAQKLGLDMDKFAQDLTSDALKRKIENDLAYGQSIGINSTPTFYLNGNKLNLSTFDDLKQAVSEVLR